MGGKSFFGEFFGDIFGPPSNEQAGRDVERGQAESRGSSGENQAELDYVNEAVETSKDPLE